MRCPVCGNDESKVIDSRSSDDGTSIRRRRECLACSHRFTTYERISDSPLVVIKADGSSEVYDRQKLMRGIMTACAKRPIPPERISALIDDIETELRNSVKGQVRSKELGNMALERLSELDEVAYVRFASVYRDFQNVEEFSAALEEMKKA